MLKITMRTFWASLLLLLLPAIVWLAGWLWSPALNPSLLRSVYWISETVSSPWGVLTSLLLSIWFLWCLRFRIKSAFVLLLIIAAALVLGQGIKNYVKGQIQEPRPYVQWLGTTTHMDITAFYAMNSKDRSKEIEQQLEGNQQVPKWLSKSWEDDTDYAFPSGHTMFAATWALLAMGILWPRRHYKTVIVLMLWATLVMASRLLLGMHWPRDLMASVGISWLLVAVSSWLTQKFVGPLTLPAVERQEVVHRKER